MKVAIVGESPADEAAIAALIAAVIAEPVDMIPVAVRHGSWPKIKLVLPSVVAEIHYHTDAAAVVLVVDSDDSPLHESTHDPPLASQTGCRICDLNQILAKARARLRQRPAGKPLRIALGLAVPSIEAWLLCGIDHAVSEASWINARRQGKLAYSRLELKRRLYGSERPSLDQETAAMIREANRLAADQLRLLTQYFPVGFGHLANELHSWRSQPSDS